MIKNGFDWNKRWGRWDAVAVRPVKLVGNRDCYISPQISTYWYLGDLEKEAGALSWWDGRRDTEEEREEPG